MVHVELPCSSSDAARQQHLGAIPNDAAALGRAELMDATGHHEGDSPPPLHCRSQACRHCAISVLAECTGRVHVHFQGVASSGAWVLYKRMHATGEGACVPDAVQCGEQGRCLNGALCMGRCSGAPGAECCQSAASAGVLAGSQQGVAPSVARGGPPATSQAQPGARLPSHPRRL